jgi:phospholipid/cholesterol/gamma-HCH transport system permease protein
MREWADFSLEDDGDGTRVLALTGPLRVHAIGDLDDRLESLGDGIDRIDLSHVTDIDTTGAWIVRRVSEENGAEITGASEEAQRLVSALSHITVGEAEPPPQPGPAHRIVAGLGGIVSAWGIGFVKIVAFLGETLIAGARIARHPARFRGTALVHQMQLVGVDSLGIIGLMSFLVGIVIAQQGAVQLQEFGAEIYTINLTGRLALRELGILMTAIMVAGRSGSSFAAQIGTMKLTEEIDAMRTIGVSPIEALVIPRVVASMILLPLLGFYAALAAIIGGAFISIFQLGIPFFTFLSRIHEVVPTQDLWVGLNKGPVFGLIVAIAGCYQGMQVEANSEEVGIRTTQSVVTAIFTVIVLDAFFAVFFTELGWG